MYCKMKMSHSIYMSGIQIDTIKVLHQIVLLCKPYETEYFHYARLLDTLEYTDGTTAAELNVFLMLTGLLWIVPVPETTL